MQYRPLGKTGLKVSILSYGASPLGSVFRSINEADGHRTVHTALDLGINLIDVSPYYGLTKAETVLGQGLKGIDRGRYYLATKVGRYGPDFKDFDFSAARVESSLNESLARLGTDYVDIIQCHDIEFGNMDQVIDETLPALATLVKKGKARFVGITGLPMKVFRYVLERASDRVDTILSYCHYSLNDTALAEVLPFLQERNIGVMNASPLAMGLLSERGSLPEWHPAPAQLREAAHQAAQHCRSRGRDIAELAIQFAVANPGIATTLVGTANPENIAKNVRWAATPPDPVLLGEVLKILAPVHNVSWPSGHPENN
jgi:L-galactose dehydrogenase